MNEYDDGFDAALSMIENLVDAARADELEAPGSPLSEGALEAYGDVMNMIAQLREVGEEE